MRNRWHYNSLTKLAYWIGLLNRFQKKAEVVFYLNYCLVIGKYNHCIFWSENIFIKLEIFDMGKSHWTRYRYQHLCTPSIFFVFCYLFRTLYTHGFMFLSTPLHNNIMYSFQYRGIHENIKHTGFNNGFIWIDTLLTLGLDLIIHYLLGTLNSILLTNSSWPGGRQTAFSNR